MIKENRNSVKGNNFVHLEFQDIFVYLNLVKASNARAGVVKFIFYVVGPLLKPFRQCRRLIWEDNLLPHIFPLWTHGQNSFRGDFVTDSKIVIEIINCQLSWIWLHVEFWKFLLPVTFLFTDGEKSSYIMAVSHASFV